MLVAYLPNLLGLLVCLSMKAYKFLQKDHALLLLDFLLILQTYCYRSQCLSK